MSMTILIRRVSIPQFPGGLLSSSGQASRDGPLQPGELPLGGPPPELCMVHLQWGLYLDVKEDLHQDSMEVIHAFCNILFVLGTQKDFHTNFH